MKVGHEVYTLEHEYNFNVEGMQWMIVYLARNKVTRKVYIGQTQCALRKRKFEHIYAARRGDKHPFYDSIRKYGENNFTFKIIARASNSEELNNLEELLIRVFQSNKRAWGYNLATGGDVRRGWHHTKETRKKLSLLSLGNTSAVGSKSRKGQKTPLEVRKKQLEGLRRFWNSKKSIKVREKCKENGRKTWLGKTFSKEHKNKISRAVRASWELRRKARK